MRKINKSASPDFFENWKIKYRNDNGKDATYSDLIGEYT